MKKSILLVLATTTVLSAWAEPPNRPPEGKDRADRHEQFEKRKFDFMNRELDKLGITEKQKHQVGELQKTHRQLMEANGRRTAEARKKLATLQDEGADWVALNAAIDEVASSQAEQLRILVKNRIEMENIIGKENYKKLMESARNKMRKFRDKHEHGGRSERGPWGERGEGRPGPNPEK